jgi:hypothetical protein
MFFWFLVAVGIVVGLTLVGAWMSRRSHGDDWESREDRPIAPFGDH